MPRTAEILIAEESPTEAAKLMCVLEQHNYKVSVEHNGELALASIRRQQPKIVISETQLPEVNGFELCRQIKADEKLQGTFVILLTALSDPKDVIRGLECGADSFIAKGFDEKLLMSRIENIMHRAMEEALSASEKRYYQLLENSPETIALHSDGLIVYVNPAGIKLLRASNSDELIGKPIMSFVHSVDQESESTRGRSGRGEPITFSEKRLVRLDGQVIDVEVIDTPTTYKGKPAGQLIIRDVTEYKLAEEAKLESQQQYESLVNSLDGIVWELDAQSFRFTFVSKQAERMLGYPREQWTTDPNFWTDRLHPDDKWAVNACLESIADRKDHQLEYRMIAADGRVVWLKDIVTVERLEGENPRVRGVMFDITASKLAEEEKSQLSAQIESHRQRLDAILTNLPSVIWESWNEPLEGQPLNFVSDYVETMLGYTVEEWVSKPNFWLSIVYPEDRQRVAEAFESKLDAGKSQALEFRWIAKNGRVIWVEAQAMVMRDRAGEIVGFRGVGLDITELKRAERALMESEERLRQSQKMEAIGTLAGGVAHDFNNLLTAILGNTQLAMRKLQKAGSAEVHLVEVEKAGNRAAALTRQTPGVQSPATP